MHVLEHTSSGDKLVVAYDSLYVMNDYVVQTTPLA